MDWEDIDTFDGVINPSKCLDCLGDENSNEFFHPNSFIKSREIDSILNNSKICPKFVDSMKTIDLFNYKFDMGSAFTNQNTVIFNLARKNLLMLERKCISTNHLRSDIQCDKLNYYELRIQVTELLYYCRQFMRQIFTHSNENAIQSYCCKELMTKTTAFRLCLKSFSNLPNYIISHSGSRQGNICSQAVYHFFHGHLEWRWHHLLLVFDLNNYQNLLNAKINTEFETTEIDLTNSVFEEYLLLFMADLTTIAIERFEKVQINDILNVTPFSCSCVRECWLLIQLLVEEFYSKGRLKSFWTYFNEILSLVSENIIEDKEMTDCTKLSLSYSYKCSNPTGFSIWLLVHVAKLHGFDKRGNFIGYSSQRISSNYGELVCLLKSCIGVELNISETQLRVYINLISEILTNWWEPKNDILTLLWEYFQKRLNSSFYIQGSAPDSIAVSSKTAAGMLRKIKLRLSTSPTHRHESSYNNFLYLLGKHFSRCRENGETAHWQKFKGRIYPKFPQNKLQSLTEMGLLNFASLFLTLAVSVDVKEIGVKLEQLLSQLQTERLDNPCKTIILKTHLALLMLSIENNLDITYITNNLLHLVNSCSVGLSNNKDGSSSIIRIFIEGFRDIVDISQDFQLSEYLLIDAWISKYLYTCSQNDQSKLLDILITIMSKLKVLYQQVYSIGIQHNIEDLTNGFMKVCEMFWHHVLPFVRQNATNNNSTSQVADMAIYFTLFSLYDQTLCLKFDQSFPALFKYFSQNENVNIRITRRYLCRILLHTEVINHLQSHVPKFESHIVQSWIKCCILCYEDFRNQELKDLFSTVYEFEDMKQLCSSGNISLLDADDTLCSLFNIMGNRFNNSSSFQEKCHVRELFNSYLSILEKHIVPLVKNPTSMDLTIRIYSVIAVLFLHCSSLMYVRSKPTCLLHVLLTQIILPPALFMDKKPHPYVISAMRKTWHLYIKGLFRLDHKTDPYIDKTLKDLIVVYIPYFTIKNNTMEKYNSVQPLQKLICADGSDDHLVAFFYEKLSINFLACRGKQVNQNSALVLVLLLDVVHKIKNEPRLMKLFVLGLTTCLLEQIMFLEDFSPSRKIACDIIETITVTPAFSSNNELRSEFSKSLVLLSQKHLAFSANYFFRLLHKLVDLFPLVIENTLPSVRDQVACVEARRGVGVDEGLRTALRKLETYIQKSKSNTGSKF